MSAGDIAADVALSILEINAGISQPSSSAFIQNQSCNPAEHYQARIEKETSPTSTLLSNGTLTIVGNELSLISAVEMQVQPQQTVKQIQLTIAGTKKTTGSYCFLLSTFIAGCLLLFPLLFMSCTWWKKIVYPMYEISTSFYRLLPDLLRKHSQCKMLSLIVYDNALDAEKASVLRGSLQASGLKGFVFKNKVICCDYKQSESKDFVQNMGRIKQLPMLSLIEWNGLTC